MSAGLPLPALPRNGSPTFATRPGASAIGLSVRGYIVFAASFAAFLISPAIRLHSGGRSLPGQRPARVGSSRQMPLHRELVQTMADTAGISYVRATRGAYPIIYGPDEKFPLGGCKVHHAGPTTP
jgi:transketolase